MVSVATRNKASTLHPPSKVMDGWRRRKSHTAHSEWTVEGASSFTLAFKSAAAQEVTGSDVLSVVCDRLAKH